MKSGISVGKRGKVSKEEERNGRKCLLHSTGKHTKTGGRAITSQKLPTGIIKLAMNTRDRQRIQVNIPEKGFESVTKPRKSDHRH